jgi:hypothetical protein
MASGEVTALAEVAQAAPQPAGDAPDDGTRPVTGSGGLVLPLPPPSTADRPTAAPPAVNSDPGIALAGLPLVPMPAEPDATPDGPRAAAPTEEEPSPPEAAGPAAPAVLTASFRPLLKHDGMLGIRPAPVVTLDLPLARLEAASGRLDPVLLDGTDGADTLWGGAGPDRLAGGAGDDVLFGGLGADTLLGGEGDDILMVTGGTKLLTGGPGRDLFIIGLPDMLRGGLGRITDFESGQDALLVAVGPNDFDGHGWLSWYSRTMTINVLDPWEPGEPGPPERFGVLVDYPARRFWELSVETPRIRDLWMSAGPSDVIIADPTDPANARIIERPDGEDGSYLPRVLTPPAADLDLL